MNVTGGGHPSDSALTPHKAKSNVNLYVAFASLSTVHSHPLPYHHRFSLQHLTAKKRKKRSLTFNLKFESFWF